MSKLGLLSNELGPLECESSSNAPPFVSVVVPCRNEERYIAQCLDSILANDYPKDRMEILVLDGMSEDKTGRILEGYAQRFPFIRVVENRKKTIPAAMNTGIRHARGDVIIKMDAHSVYDPRHISACVRYQREYGAENVGGVWCILPGADSSLARSIVFALGSRFGSGNARIKIGVKRPTWSDAVAFGCYRREFLKLIGPFDERINGSEDMDMNARIRAGGGRILIVPEIVVNYFADATLGAFWKHNFADGVWATYVLKFGSKGWAWRHWVPMAFVASFIACLGLSFLWRGFFWMFLTILATYAVSSVGTSVRLAVRGRSALFALLLPCVFAVRHFAFGAGSLYGAFLAALPGVYWKGGRGARC